MTKKTNTGLEPAAEELLSANQKHVNHEQQQTAAIASIAISLKRLVDGIDALLEAARKDGVLK